MTADHIRTLLKDSRFEHVESEWLGRTVFNTSTGTLADFSNCLQSSGMVVQLDPGSSSLHLSLFAHSLRKNVARALSMPVMGKGPNQTTNAVEPWNHPIDVVYTWVDCDDPQWKKDYADTLAKYGASSPKTASDIVRFQDRDELKYSLRSLEMFAPWVNHIYIVTNGQKPHWLNLNNPKISLVTHAQIFERETDLPTFNSHAIEANLHRIPGLSEHFLYFNDDVFLADWCTPETFFNSSGQSKYFESENQIPDDPSLSDLPSNWAAHNNRKLLEEEFGYRPTKKFKHTAHAQRLSTLRKAVSTFGQQLEETTSKRFRHRDDVALPSNLAHHFGAILGTAIPADIDYRYIDINSVGADVKLSRLLLWDTPTIFCLNQVSSSGNRGKMEAAMIQGFLQNYFPWKSFAEI